MSESLREWRERLGKTIFWAATEAHKLDSRAELNTARITAELGGLLGKGPYR